MGSNDFCQNDPRKVCTDIISYVKYLRDGMGVRMLCVESLLQVTLSFEQITKQYIYVIQILFNIIC